MTYAIRHSWFWLAMFLLIALVVLHFAASSAAAQVVQLPTFHFFTVDTTVLVPDGGDAALGGIGRSSSGRVSRGVPGLPGRPFQNIATGSSTGAGNVSVSAQIHDLDAMDRALLGDDALADSPNGSFHTPLAIVRRANQLPTINRAAGASAKPASVSALQAQAAAEDATRNAAAAAELAKGRELLAEGKAGVAKIYFQNAARHASGETQKQAIAALESLDRSKSARVAGQ
jgi:hypothetical protein